MRDVEYVEKQLDLILGNKKMHFNQPKYHRHEEQTSDGGNKGRIQTRT